MQQPRQGLRSKQDGVVLISGLLLLLVVTIMALSMFRSFGMQEKIAGNVREKQRALQAANSTQQFAEWWLSNLSNAPWAESNGNAQSIDVVCTNVLLDANLGAGQICGNSLLQLTGVGPVSWPTAGTSTGVMYTPPGMNVTNPAQPNYYPNRPRFYIQDLGSVMGSPQGEVYQVDAYAYGLTGNAIAVVESTVAVVTQVANLGGLQ
jgi:type IV pilus assembly protein PilX